MGQIITMRGKNIRLNRFLIISLAPFRSQRSAPKNPAIKKNACILKELDNKMKKEKKINRKQALKRMGKYAGLTSIGTFILLNPEKAQAQSPLTPGEGFQNFKLNLIYSLKIVTRFISNILFDKEINLVLFPAKNNNKFWDCFVKIGSTHYIIPALYYKLKQRDYLKLLNDELVSYLHEIYNQNLKRNMKKI